MKKLIYLITAVLLAAFILPSCNSSLSITKRRYTKGYFVQHTNNKHKKPDRQQQTDIAGNAATVQNNELRTIEYVAAPEKAEIKRAENVLLARAAARNTGFAAVKGEPSLPAMAVKKPIKTLAMAGSLVETAARGDDALSLLWVVVVVILIIYLLGLLFNNFGLGNIIHILGAIALVLLILWLLRLL